MLCPDPRVPKDHRESNSYAKAKSLYASRSSYPLDPPTQRDSMEDSERLRFSSLVVLTAV